MKVDQSKIIMKEKKKKKKRKERKHRNTLLEDGSRAYTVISVMVLSLRH